MIPNTARLISLFLAIAAGVASGYETNDRWQLTATDGLVTAGEPITLTWGFAADGTFAPPGAVLDQGVNSDLIASLDGWFGDNGGGTDLTQRPWFGYVQSGFDRWSELTGVTFVYEPADDGATHTSFAGQLGVRADVRLAGGPIDGTTGGNLGTAAFATSPDSGDLFFDTSDTAYYSDPGNNAFGLRYTLMHEIGHVLGLGHIESTNSALLMEAQPQTRFDGPQQDDLRGAQSLYGDPYERLGGDAGGVSAIDLGPLGAGQSLTVGADGANSQRVAFTTTDFLSVQSVTDQDFFAIDVPAGVEVVVTATPVGASYNQRTLSGNPFENIRAREAADLYLSVLPAGESAQTADLTGFGEPESVSLITSTAGRIEVSIGASSAKPQPVQLYQLSIQVNEAALPGDYNGDGLVDAADYTIYRDTFGSMNQLAADGDQSGHIDTPDKAVWAAAYGSGVSSSAIPEPAGGVLLLTTIGPLLGGPRGGKKRASIRASIG